MAAAALVVIFATQPPQQHQKGVFDSYKDATGYVWFHKHQECVGFCRKSQIKVRLALGLAPGGVRLGGSHHHSVRLGGNHHQGLWCVGFGYNTTRVRSGFDKSTKGALVSRLPQMGAFWFESYTTRVRLAVTAPRGVESKKLATPHALTRLITPFQALAHATPRADTLVQLGSNQVWSKFGTTNLEQPLPMTTRVTEGGPF
nr:hypothetical protein [Tanacetum cinerariifolium]